ncbi:MAG: YebC/PmpR family DNA-binding transcriptional regulator [Candidatus Omnitrophica bacterium CG07_land_8_20_14_0_80_42_15]|uniref:Probable transcriptional regulatory protein COS99_02575 n=1 Tax=Candidatus Aquitaenariimonas noxiae TaxID=1974741 RepID=A0A2J0KU88_9BACT|nr:MAG: YebC/PmpR family DNA-binding transcriptional regulator [Candidatus Omnitrophica bacterium CG07_land_8_20_14_0_80_42_15]
MSGHSKWASIKHSKGLADAKRGQLFTKLIKEITVAARDGGKPEANPRLRVAIQRAKESNMPQDNIDRAIKKGTGELPGVVYEEITYEGYGPNGVAIIIDVLTDNKNRTGSEIRNIFAKRGGNMAGSGSVSWMFEKKGYFLIKKGTIDEDKLMGIALEAGAEDLIDEGDGFAIKTQPQDFEKVKSTLEQKGIKIDTSEITKLPKSNIRITDKGAAEQVLTLIETLEEHDDIQNVYANFDIPDDLLPEEK